MGFFLGKGEPNNHYHSYHSLSFNYEPYNMTNMLIENTIICLEKILNIKIVAVAVECIILNVSEFTEVTISNLRLIINLYILYYSTYIVHIY